MTLDEVIEHANRVADSYKDTAPECKSAHEHRQLADWLTELKVLRTENAKLRELVRDMFGGYKGAVEMLPSSYSKNVMEMVVMHISERMSELGVEVEP